MKTFYKLLLFFFCVQLYAQDKGKLSISPYGGFSSPIGEFKNYATKGNVFGAQVHYLFSERFGIGLDAQFASFGLENSFSVEGLPPSFSQTFTENGKWQNTTFAIGPVYRIPAKKVNWSLYALFGSSSVKSPEVRGTFAGGSLPAFEHFRMLEQSESSLVFTSGLKIDFKLSDRFGLFINPQYVYSGAKIKYGYRNPEPAYILGPANVLEFNEGLYFEQPFTEEELSLFHFNISAGISIDLGGSNPRNEEPNNNLNPQMCDITYDGFTCLGSSTRLNFTSTWTSHNPLSTIEIELYQSGNLVASGNQITNNLQNLNSSSGSLNHTFSSNSITPGFPMLVRVMIKDVNNNLICDRTFDDFESPNCDDEQKPCSFQIDQSTYTCDFNSVIINASASWTNLPVGAVVNVIATQQSNSAVVPLSFSPTIFPYTITGANNASFNRNFSIEIPRSYIGRPIVMKMQYTDPMTGQVISCEGGADFTVPNCPNDVEVCELTAEPQKCTRTRRTMVDFTANWMNYQTPSGYTTTLKLYDSNRSPINVNIPNNGGSIGVAGTRTFSVDLSQYTGHIVYAVLKICDSYGKNCCEKEIKIKIPKCCIDCFDIEMENSTPYTNPNIIANEFPITGYFYSKPVSRVMFQLEAFNANNLRTNRIVTPANFEFSKNSLINGGRANLVGSLTGDRSNLIIKNFATPTTSGVNFKLMVDNYTDKKVTDYRIKVTAFFADGTYCEEYLKK